MTLRALAALFLRVGNATFGGGDAITATFQRELVHRRRWLSVERFGLAQSLAKITPGTGILAFCAAAGWMLARGAGALAAVLAVSVPSAAIAVALTWGFTSLEGSAPARGALGAVLASAVGMMWAAGWLLVGAELRPATALRTAGLVVGAFLALAWWSFPPLQILAAAALVGACWTGGEAA
jgi:chromate transporter